MKTREINLESNRATYIDKMHRQIREADEKINALQKTAEDRHASENTRVERRLSEVTDKMAELKERFNELEEESEEMWAERSRDVSQTYRELEELIYLADSRVKKK